MTLYKYKAMDSTGRDLSGTLDALNEESASQMLRREGFFVTKLTLEKPIGSSKKFTFVINHKLKGFIVGVVSTLLIQFIIYLIILLVMRES